VMARTCHLCYAGGINSRITVLVGPGIK
jgi:hypothetical protein